MLFNDIIPSLMLGARIRRKTWSDDMYIRVLENNRVGICYLDDSQEEHIIEFWDESDRAFSLEEVLASDWEVFI